MSACVLLALAGPVSAQTAQKSSSSANEMALGQQLLATGRLAEAERAFAAAVAKTPGDAGAWNYLGNARFAQKLWTPAIEAFERARALLRSNGQVSDNIGACWFSLSEFERARECFERAVALDAGDARAHMFLGRLAASRCDDATAESEYKLALAHARDEPLAPLYWGLYLFQHRRLDEAKQAFELCLQISPDTPGAHLNLGLILQRQGDKPQAEAHLKRFRELSDVQHSDERKQVLLTHLLRAANDDAENGRYDSAVAALLQAVEVAPELPLLQKALERVYRLQGRTDDAARALERFEMLTAKAAGK